jgi:hypothetical protein
MKKLLLLLALLVAHTCADAAVDNKLAFAVHQKDYRYSTEFEFYSDDEQFGYVAKSSLRLLKHLRDTYDVYDENGDKTATGISRIMSLGLFRTWAAEFDIYDANNNYLGMIDGQFATSASAKYSIYNADGQKVGIAYLDLSNAGFTIKNPAKETQIIATLTRNFIQDQIDYWDVVVKDKQAIHPDIIKVFAAFAIDYQEVFKADK